MTFGTVLKYHQSANQSLKQTSPGLPRKRFPALWVGSLNCPSGTVIGSVTVFSVAVIGPSCGEKITKLL